MWMLYALIAAVLWGFNYALSERILSTLSPASLLALEMLIGGVVFSAVSYFTTLKQDWHTLINEPKLFWLTLLEVAVVVIASFCIVLSIRSKNATQAGIIELIYPLFTIFFTWVLFRENHINLSVLAGGGLIFTGVFLISR